MKMKEGGVFMSKRLWVLEGSLGCCSLGVRDLRDLRDLRAFEAHRGHLRRCEGWAGRIEMNRPPTLRNNTLGSEEHLYTFTAIFPPRWLALLLKLDLLLLRFSEIPRVQKQSWVHGQHSASRVTFLYPVPCAQRMWSFSFLTGSIWFTILRVAIICTDAVVSDRFFVELPHYALSIRSSLRRWRCVWMIRSTRC